MQAPGKIGTSLCLLVLLQFVPETHRGARAAGAQPNAVYGTLLKNSAGHFRMNTIPKEKRPSSSLSGAMCGNLGR
jgi:hypothetical protein